MGRDCAPRLPAARSRLRLRLCLQNTAALLTSVLSLNLVQRLRVVTTGKNRQENKPQGNGQICFSFFALPVRIYKTSPILYLTQYFTVQGFLHFNAEKINLICPNNRLSLLYLKSAFQSLKGVMKIT